MFITKVHSNEYVYCGQCKEIYPIIEGEPMCNGRVLDKCFYCKGPLYPWKGHGMHDNGWDEEKNYVRSYLSN